MKPALIVCALAVGLIIDRHFGVWGQVFASLGVWALFLALLESAQPRERTALIACLVYATAGELFLSLVWGLYQYRLENIPPFVPPGHALLFTLGAGIAARMKDSVVWIVPVIALPYLLYAAVQGFDTMGVVLFAIFVLCLFAREARKLYATMFALSLLLELYGTWVGNWVWRAQVPWLGLTSTNPPAAAGAFYCVLDLLIVATVASLHRAIPAAEPDRAPA
jgi:hypothetical protein